MMRIHSKLAIAALLPFALSACGGGGGGGTATSTTPPTTTPTATAFQDRFGTAFAADFNASSTATAPHPASTDVPALNLTAEPFDNG